MSTLINGDTLYGNIVIDKQSGTVVTLGTESKFVEKNISLNLSVREGSVFMQSGSIGGIDPSITVSETGVVTATVNSNIEVAPAVSAGYVSGMSVIPGSIDLNGYSTYTLPIATIAETRAYLGIS